VFYESQDYVGDLVTDAIALKVRQEFAAKDKAKKTVKPSAVKPHSKKAA
jgi:hypothetical protein